MFRRSTRQNFQAALVKEQFRFSENAGNLLSSSSRFSCGACDEENVVSPHKNLESFPIWILFHGRIADCPQLHQFFYQNCHKLVPT